ncbi:DNA integrity scanning protein DisA [Thermincola ferriacetica]|uniref:DNA integrity scanning protein DisA n=2 Tax=Thermincola TaxID=278993 RepID=D5X9R5_THEPJ|nr:MULTISPECIES: DNA integrity scanning diadenylate cyclase DisA [Thermincola]ADG81136.1 DNA integrity scanning, DisA, linker region [Thermincola potens JR]KNZ68467.1 DNA integrity scanning protein DisA [Thermincola ferriacetica]
MKEEVLLDEEFLKAIRILAPGTPLREGLENILKAKTGALIVIGDSPQVLDIVEGGFDISTDLTPANLYELAKMDGAIILSHDAKKILFANTQLIPDPNIPSQETGIRHRTAERVTRQTGALVISISQRRSVITLYKGTTKYVLRDINVILAKANQALQTLEKYKVVLDKALATLSTLEFQDLVTLYDVAKVVQRTEMVVRIVKEIETYISELGTEGRLISMQLEELVADVEDDGLLIIQDYYQVEDKKPEDILATIGQWSSEDLLDLTLICRALGYTGSASILDQSVSPRGYRILYKIPRLPWPVIENLVNNFKSLQRILNASIEELDDVEGIGEVRARAIKEGLKRYRDQVLLDRHHF